MPVGLLIDWLIVIDCDWLQGKLDDMHEARSELLKHHGEQEAPSDHN